MRGRMGSIGFRASGASPKAASLLLLLVLLVPYAAAGEKPPRADELGRLPIEITADRLNADSARESVTFEGNVMAVQGDVTLYAERLFAVYSRDVRAIERITAEGKVRVVHAGREARAARAVFYNLEQKIVLTGGADLVQGENTLKGDTVTIFLRENRSVVTGGEGGRVRAVIHPQGILQMKEKEDR